MKNARILKGNGGFSLVELMVVVAIIGILATVAIPSVNKYMLKARQTEAKTNLSALYSANKAFNVEYNGYGSHFSVIGYAPEGQLRYTVGFGAARALADYQAIMGPGITALPNTFVTSFTYCGDATVGTGCDTLAEGSAGTTETVPAAYAATDAAFVAGARSTLAKTGTVIDEWTMNQNRLISNTTNGIQ